MTENNNRVCCLYRVSTDKQVDFNSNHEADLPMQRKACHKFAESKGWVIVHEEQEEGVSGHKVRAAARDKLQIIKDYARKASSISCWCSCLTALVVSQMKRPLLWNGLYGTASGYGVPKRVSSVSTTTLTNC